MRITRMLKVVLGVSAVLSPVVVFAQNDANDSPMQQMTREQQQPGSHSTPNQQQGPLDSDGASGMTGQQMKDKIFLRKAAEGGIAAVKMGQLAADKGTSDDVKSFGTRMVTDHTTLSDEMKPIADSIGVRLPKTMNKMDQAEYDRLSGLSGEEFEKAYISDMLKDHRKDIRAFHEEAMATNDPSLKAAVEKAEGVMREHARMIVRIAKEKGMLPPAPGKGAPVGAPTPPPGPPPLPPPAE